MNDVKHYLKYRKEYDQIRAAFRYNQITRQQFFTLRGQIKAGDASGAIKDLAKLLMRK